jgi:hypothetical protein
MQGETAGKQQPAYRGDSSEVEAREWQGSRTA